MRKGLRPVSYTHLDVYKRQLQIQSSKENPLQDIRDGLEPVDSIIHGSIMHMVMQMLMELTGQDRERFQ